MLKYGKQNSKIFSIWGGGTAPSPDPTPRRTMAIDRNGNFLFHALMCFFFSSKYSYKQEIAIDELFKSSVVPSISDTGAVHKVCHAPRGEGVFNQRYERLSSPTYVLQVTINMNRWMNTDVWLDI